MRVRATALALTLFTSASASAMAAQDAVPPVPPPPGAEVPPAPPPPPAEPAMPAPVAPAPAPAPAAPAAAAPSVSAGPLNFEALVDTYYQFNFTGDPNTQGPALRAFDDQSNSFTLNYTKVAAYMNADPVGFRIDLGYGHTGAIINQGASLPGSAADPKAAGGRVEGLYNSALLIQQAYATAKLGMFTVDAGKFVTSASDEVIETNKNWNYSRSLLFNGVPFLHTGLRIGAQLSEMVGVNLQLVNGWNNDPDNNKHKTIGGQVSLTLPSKTNIFATTYIGIEGASDTRMLYDLVVAQALSDTLALSLNADFAKEGDAQWWGAGVKGRAVLSDMFNLALRLEYLKSKDGGYAGLMNAGIFEGTVTAGIPVAKNYEIRAEVRGDFGSEDIFTKGAEARGNQFTGLVGFLAWLP